MGDILGAAGSAAGKVIDALIACGNFLRGLPLLICLLTISVIYTVGTRGFQIRYFGHILKNTFGKQFSGKSGKSSGISSFKAFCMALCNTLGTGNIAGVGVAIALGGPGAALWIIFADVLALIIKYGEIALGVKCHELYPVSGNYRGGLMWYVEKGLGRQWKWIAVVYAAFYGIAIINTPAVQVNSMASAIVTFFPIPTIAVGIVCAVFMGIVLIGGVKRLGAMAERVVPFMAVLYVLGTIFILVKFAPEIPGAISLMFRSAFSDTAAIAGGFGGATMMQAARHGAARGFYSNGAGCGDAPFAHASADVSNPAEQAIWGVSEVFVDAIVCTCTALVILITGSRQSGLSGAQLSIEAFAVAFGNDTLAGVFISVIIIFFAFTTAVMCSYFGELCIGYLVKDMKVVRYVYRVIMCLSAIAGSSAFLVEHLNKLWLLGDFNLAVDTILSVLVLFLMRKQVFALTQDYTLSIKQNAGRLKS